MKKRNKKGQFYFVAAIIIIMLVSGVVLVSNSFTKENPTKIYELKEELEIESAKVLEYNLYNEENKLENFTKTFSENVGGDIKIYFITGNETNMEAYTYNQSSQEDINCEVSGGKINITVDEKEYSFDLKSGENFYFIIIQETNGEKYIVTN